MEPSDELMAKHASASQEHVEAAKEFEALRSSFSTQLQPETEEDRERYKAAHGRVIAALGALRKVRECYWAISDRRAARDAAGGLGG